MDELIEMLEHAADGAFIIDSGQNIIYWNRAAQDMLGYTPDEVMDQPCYNILRGCDDRGQVLCRHHCDVSIKALTGKAVSNYDLAVCSRSGEMRWINMSILTFEAVSGDVAPVVVHLFRDATQTKQNEQFIHQMFATVEQWQKTTAPEMPSGSAEPGAEVLTDREREVLSLLARGYGTAEIAQALSISSATVRNHVQSILHKLRVHSRLEAVTYARKHSLVNRD